MDMTISAVQLGTSSQPQAKTTESGFSDVLTEVRTASPQVQTSAPQQTPEQPLSDGAEIQQAILSEGVTLEAETFSVDFRETVIELISGISDESLEENNRIIDALLEILKKMNKGDEEDTAISLLAELLASMTGDTSNSAAFQLKASVSETAITSVNTEITAILSAESESAENPNAALQNTSPAFDAQQTNEAHLSAQVEQPTAAGQPIIAEQTDASAAKNVETAPAQPETLLTEQPVSADTYKKLLDDILAAARKDLGLTKAELTASPEVPAEETVQLQPQNEKVSFTVSLNRKDGTDELKSILGEVIDDNPDSDTEFKMPVAQDNSAPFMANLPKQTDAIAPEKPQAIEAPLPEQQIADEILSKPEAVNGGRTEFTMELNPENLGKITVRLVSADGKVQVNITAENDSTRALLENRAENIGAALRNNGVELEQYQVVSEREEAQLMQESYDGSSKNPYGRNDEEQQQNEDGDDFLEILQQL